MQAKPETDSNLPSPISQHPQLSTPIAQLLTANSWAWACRQSEKAMCNETWRAKSQEVAKSLQKDYDVYFWSKHVDECRTTLL